MLSKKSIESFLSVNGLSSTAPDEEIKSVLLSAKWHEDDVDTALTILRENTVTHTDRVETIRNVFQTDAKMKPETIESLLGISVDMDSTEIAEISAARAHVSILQVFIILLCAVVFAAVTIIAIMYHSHVGIFYTA